MENHLKMDLASRGSNIRGLEQHLYSYKYYLRYMLYSDITPMIIYINVYINSSKYFVRFSVLQSIGEYLFAHLEGGVIGSTRWWGDYSVEYDVGSSTS